MSYRAFLVAIFLGAALATYGVRHMARQTPPASTTPAEVAPVVLPALPATLPEPVIGPFVTTVHPAPKKKRVQPISVQLESAAHAQRPPSAVAPTSLTPQKTTPSASPSPPEYPESPPQGVLSLLLAGVAELIAIPVRILVQ